MMASWRKRGAALWGSAAPARSGRTWIVGRYGRPDIRRRTDIDASVEALRVALGQEARLDVSHAFGSRIRRRQDGDVHVINASVAVPLYEVVAQQHGVVLVDRVVAVVHVGSAELAEPDLESDVARGVADVPDVLPLAGLHGSNARGPRERLGLLEVQVHRVAPAAAALDRPLLDVARPRQVGDAPHVRQLRHTAVHLNAPGLGTLRVVEGQAAAVRAAYELDDASPDRRDGGNLPIRARIVDQALVLRAAAVRDGVDRRRVVDARQLAHHFELHDRADARIGPVARKRLPLRELRGDSPPVDELQLVDEVLLLPDLARGALAAREVDDEVVALRGPLHDHLVLVAHELREEVAVVADHRDR